MKPETLLSILTTAGKLKTVTRHCDLNETRKESVAEHLEAQFYCPASKR